MARAIGKNNKLARDRETERERGSVPLYIFFKFPFLMIHTSKGHNGTVFGRSLHLFAHSSASSERRVPSAKQVYALTHSGYART